MALSEMAAPPLLATLGESAQKWHPVLGLNLLKALGSNAKQASKE